MVFRRPEDCILAVYIRGAALVCLLQGLAIGAAAASCNILDDTADTADTEHDHISDMSLYNRNSSVEVLNTYIQRPA